MTITHDALDLTIQGAPGSGPASQTWGLTIQGPPAHPDMFKLVHNETCKVGKRADDIPLECFLVIIYSCGGGHGSFDPIPHPMMSRIFPHIPIEIKIGWLLWSEHDTYCHILGREHCINLSQGSE